MKISAIIGARLNSSRLPGKHLLELAGQPLIQRLIDRIRQSKLVTNIVLATTDDDYNQPLLSCATKIGISSFSFDGDVNNLMARIDAVIQQENSDYIVYICGDCPLVEPTFIDMALQQLIANKDKDTIGIDPIQVNIHEGIALYSRIGWEKLYDISTTTMTREHVGYADHLTPTLEKLMITDSVDYPRLKHRISVDTASDYRFMSLLYNRWYATHNANSIISFKWAQQQIIEDKQLREINSHVLQKKPEIAYKKITLFCHISQEIGMGHLKRCSQIADAVQENKGYGTEIHVLGQKRELPWLNAKIYWYDDSDIFFNKMANNETPLWVLDFHPEKVNLEPLLSSCINAKKYKHTKLLAIDNMECIIDVVDRLFIPSFYSPLLGPKVTTGWQNYLFKPHYNTNKNKQLLVVTGGSDALGYSQYLPELLDKIVPKSYPIHWVQGPYANEPNIMNSERWYIHKNPENLSLLMSNSEIILTCYGVSLFESIASGGLTLLLPTKSLCNKLELKQLAKQNCCLIISNDKDIEPTFHNLFENSESQQLILDNAQNLTKKINGLENISQLIETMLISQ